MQTRKSLSNFELDLSILLANPTTIYLFLCFASIKSQYSGNRKVRVEPFDAEKCLQKPNQSCKLVLALRPMQISSIYIIFLVLSVLSACCSN